MNSNTSNNGLAEEEYIELVSKLIDDPILREIILYKEETTTKEEKTGIDDDD
jgi:hypothetical protein